MKTRTHRLLAISAVAAFLAVPPAAPMHAPRRRPMRPTTEQPDGKSAHRKRLDAWLLQKNLEAVEHG